MNNFDLNLFKTFYIVAKCGSFTKAAEQLYISQPAITQSIKKLEEQLDVQLFKRIGNNISLTKEGNAVFFYSEKIYELADANSNLLNELREIQVKTINIGVPTHIGTFYFVKYLKKFNEKFPEIKVNIINKKSDEMLKMLIKRELDIVIDTDMTDVDNKLIITHKILDLESCFVCNEKYKYVADKGAISSKELTKYPLILPSKTTSNRQMIDMFFKQDNIVLNPLIEANSSSISKGIISQGIGIGWMIKEFIEDDLKTGKLFEVNVNIEQTLTPVSIAYNNKYINDIVKSFISIFKERVD